MRVQQLKCLITCVKKHVRESKHVLNLNLEKQHYLLIFNRFIVA